MPSAHRRRLELAQARRLGLAILLVQLLVMLTWSAVEAAHAVQAGDFVGFFHAFYLIAHGDLNPTGWWKVEGVFIQWPLAALGVIWPHPVTLLAVQDLAIVGAEAVAYLWICDLVAEREVPVRIYCLTGLALLALNPWMYWTASWDYHSEPLGTLFAVLAARALFRGRRIGWLWCALTALAGMITATYLVGIGISLLFKHRRRLAGLAVAVAGVAWFEALVKLGAGGGIGSGSTANTPGAGSAASLGLSSRLSIAVHALTTHWLDLIANVAPSGLIGVFTAPALGITGVTLGENFSQGNPNPIIPSFQSIPVYVFVPIGTVVALIWLSRRLSAKATYTIAALLVANVAGWSAVWLPKVIPAWLNVTMTQATALRRLSAEIPRRDGVVVSEGVAGTFATHHVTRMYAAAGRPLVLTPPYTWFIVVPYAGIEPATISQSADLLSTLAYDPRARLEYANHGVWAYRLRVPRNPEPRPLVVDYSRTRFPAALFRTFGTAERHGRVRSWYMSGSDRSHGPILWGDRFLEGVGDYRATVTVEGHGPVRVEVFNDTTNRLVSSRDVRVSGSTRISLRAAITRSDPRLSDAVPSGFGPFQIRPVPSYPGNYLEVVVFSTSSETLKVRTVSLAPSRR